MSHPSHSPTPRPRGIRALTGLSFLAVVWFSCMFFGVIPAGILWGSGAGWTPPPGVTRALGTGAMALGALIWLGPLRRFVVEGRGTPAPLVPPGTLVASGLYTRVRNPMYLSYVVIALGEAILYRSAALAVYALCLWGAAHAYVVGSEEEVLRRRFGAAYVEYCARVGRWLPRRRRR